MNRNEDEQIILHRAVLSIYAQQIDDKFKNIVVPCYDLPSHKDASLRTRQSRRQYSRHQRQLLLLIYMTMAWFAINSIQSGDEDNTTENRVVFDRNKFIPTPPPFAITTFRQYNRMMSPFCWLNLFHSISSTAITTSHSHPLSPSGIRIMCATSFTSMLIIINDTKHLHTILR